VNENRPPLSVVFFGTPEFAADCLRALLEDNRFAVRLVVTQPDRPAGRGNKLTPAAVKVLATERHIPVIQPGRIRKSLPEFLTALSEEGPFDVGVVVAFGQILPQEVLDTPRAGCVNVHASLLPRWRGAAPIHRAIMSGDVETGVGLMKMEAGLDTGPVYVSQRVPISSSSTTGTLAEELSRVGGELLREHLVAVAEGKLSPTPQLEAGVTYAEKISNEEAQISWSAPAAAIERLIRALNPGPGAFTFLNGQRLKIFAARAHPENDAPQQPGAVTVVAKEQIRVACGMGSLELTEVQPAGKRRMGIAEFLRGNSLKENDHLG
jgi:methionyl-tRNA formyltransferase